jgi:ABC-type transport system involved in multi-copper enzyme maturation permease subunit
MQMSNNMHMSTQILRAEWPKCWRCPVNWALFGLLPGLLAIQFTLDALGDRETARRVFTFPNDLAIVVGGMGKLCALLAATFVAGCVGEEYRRGTWKMLLPRRAGRGGFLVAKGLICFVALAMWSAATLLSGLAIASFYGLVLGVGPWSPDGELSVVLARLASVGLEALVYGSTAFLAAVLLRSSYSAIFFGLITLKVLDFASPRLGSVAQFIPVAHLRNLEARLTDWPATLPCGAYESLVAIAVYSAICFAVAVVVFRVQEFSGTAG